LLIVYFGLSIIQAVREGLVEKHWYDDGTKIEYFYDLVGNRTKKVSTYPDNTSSTTTYSYDAANQLLSINGNEYSYDSNGNMISNGSKNFEYDANNRLTKVTKKSDGSLIASFEYDALDRRISKTTATRTTKYYYDGNSTIVLYETDGSGNLQARFIYGETGQLVSMIRGSSTYFYHYNAHGDVVALTDSNGAVVAEYDYDAWGNPIATGLEGTIENPYRYAGYRYDKEIGLYYLVARYYDSSIGTFITRDTFLGFEDEPNSWNLYSHTKKNTVMYVDPDGHFWNWVLVGVIAGVKNYIKT
jgi:RHS repeat-associated protein